MCGRYTLKTPAEALANAFDLAAPPEWSARYNVSPQQLGLIVPAGDVRLARQMRWGLETAWSRDAPRIAPPINARSESVADKPMFRDAIRRRRAICLVDGFYEWRPDRGVDLFGQPYDIGGATGRKQALYIHHRDEMPFAIGAIWESLPPREGARPSSPAAEEAHGRDETFALLTTTANALMSTIHDRMPVILNRDAIDTWLSGDLQSAQALMRPLADGILVARPVSSLVNSPRNEGPQLIAPL